MPNLFERFASLFAGATPPPAPSGPAATKAAETQTSYGRGPYARSAIMFGQGFSRRRSAEMLRNFSRNNEWVRLAIDYRREQIGKASWKIVRTDDPKKPPNAAVVKRLRQLLTFVNPLRESIEMILDMVLDDVLVIDAGCIEKEKSIGGETVALHAVDGATIEPDPTWDGRDPKAPRYSQYIDGKLITELRNDQLIYMMRTPTTYSPIGWSPVETLVRVIEADLYGEQYDFDMLKQNAPAGILSLGPGVPKSEVEAFREYYETEIAGTQQLAIFGGGEPGAGGGVDYKVFGRSNREQERQLYKEWLVKKIAAIFRIDKSVFNITESVNRATSKTQQTRTDEGLEALARLLARYLTRELVWEIDPHHGFAFDDLSDRDAKAQADIDVAYVNAGIWTRDDVRATQGLDPLPPDVPQVGPLAPVPATEPEQGESGKENEDDEDDEAGDNPPAPDDDDEDETRSAARAVPFVVVRRVPTPIARASSLGTFAPSSRPNAPG